MIFDSTLGIKFEAECYLYWIRKKYHTDISKQGYVGISTKPKNRLLAHNRCLKNPKAALENGYSKKFKNAFKSEDLIFEIVNCGSYHEVQDMEYNLRPLQNIGYNVAVGGSINGVCSRYTHGGASDFAMYNRFKRMLDFCTREGFPVDTNFKTDSGFKLFKLHLFDDVSHLQVKKKSIRLYNQDLGFVIGNYFMGMDKKNSDNDQWVYYDNRWWSKKEACEVNNVEVKTADKRISRCGMSREKAVGFVKHVSDRFEIVYLDGIACKYDSKLCRHSKETLLEVYIFYKKGARGFDSFCKDRSVEASNMIRYFKRYGLHRDVDRRTKEFMEVTIEY